MHALPSLGRRRQQPAGCRLPAGLGGSRPQQSQVPSAAAMSTPPSSLPRSCQSATVPAGNRNQGDRSVVNSAHPKAGAVVQSTGYLTRGPHASALRTSSSLLTSNFRGVTTSRFPDVLGSTRAAVAAVACRRVAALARARRRCAGHIVTVLLCNVAVSIPRRKLSPVEHWPLSVAAMSQTQPSEVVGR